jgi:uncharacterized protein (DUF1697 family)
MAECRHVALLRGINVGGRNRVAMAHLREVVLDLGHTDVATYIQSGNVVFTSEEADTATIAAALERAIAEHLGVRPTVVVLTCAELARVVADNPFPEEPNPRWVHAIFRNGPFGPDELAAVAPPSSEPATRAATTRRGWSGTPCSCTPPVASAAASWPPSCSVWVVPELPRRLAQPATGQP